MPNWCDNRVELTHEDAGMIDRAEKAFAEGKFLNEFIPVPEELYATVAGSVCGDGYAKELHTAQKALNVKYFGSQDWYEYCNKWWGVKWDVGGANTYVEREGNTLLLCFDSAWCPPLTAYGKLEELGFTVDAKYYEPGCEFCGRYTDGNDDDYFIGGDSEWVKANIPVEIDEAFAISEHMAEWEAENAR